VTDSDETRLVVRRGTAVVIVEGDEHRLRAGDEAVIGRDVTVGRYRGGADESAEPPPPYEEAERQGAAPPVVVSELREYGEWVSVPTYGTVWRPRVAVGWSPYVYGRWAWISPYGWTWVSSEPWGWYPYRCGYWLTDPVFGWIWSPYNSFVSVGFVFGSNRYWHHNVYYRPATVRFVPEGRNVRWVPLLPGERYHPAGYSRGDARLARWNQPLDRGRVFVRGGPDRREWRDYSAVHTERQAEIRKTRAAQPRPDTRTVRPETRAVRPPTAVERKGSAEPPKKGKQVQQRETRPAPEEDQGTGATRKAVPAPGKVERQAPPPRSVPVIRPPEREIVREPEPKAAPAPGKVERQAPPPRSVPVILPPEREIVREPEPKAAPVPGNVERQAPPPGSVPAARPVGGRWIVQELAPAGRNPDPGPRGQEIQGNRGGDGGGRGDDRGGNQGGGGRGR
jgi:hypothetical protein